MIKKLSLQRYFNREALKEMNTKTEKGPFILLSTVTQTVVITTNKLIQCWLNENPCATIRTGGSAAPVAIQLSISPQVY